MRNNFFKKSLLLLFLSCLLFSSTNTFAGETGKISGKVKDAKTGEPLIGANVFIYKKIINGVEQEMDHVLGAATDAEGDYYILNIPPGTYTVRASFVSYTTEIITNVQVYVDKTTPVNFNLNSQAIQTEDVVVTAYSPLKLEKDLTATKQVYNISDIENLAGISNLSDILELQPDVIDDHFRGGREGESSYLVGGSSINNPLNNKRTFSPIVSGLQSVEVYTSGFSAEYGNAQSGVINMVTREAGDTWETRIEANSSVPYYKTWNGSPYSEDNLYFYSILKNLDNWLAENPTQPGRPLWDAGYGFGTTYLQSLLRSDSLHIAKLGQILWMQGLRDIGLEYNNTIDYRVDFSVGGPVAKNLKLFLASRQQSVNPEVPTSHPDIERQVIGSISYQPSSDDKFVLRLAYDYQYDNSFNTSWYQWLFDRTLSVTQTIQNTSQIGIDWTHVFSPSTFMNFKASLLQLKTNDYIELLGPNQYSNDYSTQLNWVDYTAPSNHQVSKLSNDRGGDDLTTYDINGSLSSQLNKWNLLKSGLQFQYYDLKVNRDRNISTAGDFRKIYFNAFPYEGALYVQDKMEFEGFIANIGLRFDFYNFNADYYSNIYSPLLNPDYDPNLPYLERGSLYDRSKALTAKTSLYTRLQPRIGISFPLSENSVFHLNYGTFTQRPTFNEVFYNQITIYNAIEIIGNPRLKPANTQSYDIGLENSFPLGIKLNVSAYYKNVTDLIQAAYYYDSYQNVYQTYINRDYADIKGFYINLEKPDGDIRGYIRYNYESATGKSSNDLNAPVTFRESPREGELAIETADPADVYLDYDRTHKVVANLQVRTHKRDGFNFLGFYPLENMAFSVTFKSYSGRPYTSAQNQSSLVLNERTPTEYDLRARIEKRFNFNNTNMTVYLEGFNLLNRQVYNYSHTFNNFRNTFKFESDRANLLTYDLYEPYVTNQSIYIIQNEPIHFRLGVKVTF